uniref:Glucose-6-phosphate 1-dehydrogenase n=1 Tax=Globisporangium ultimum (strain ATCC 200006 / CBS 805.95 / DAOM BR144) TaxID=431595 RepID=K3X2M2_GLOUD
MTCMRLLLLLVLLWAAAAPSASSSHAAHTGADVWTPPPSAKTPVVRVVVLGATGNLAAKYLWVASFRLALEAFEHRGHEYEFIAAASDTQLHGDQWKHAFFSNTMTFLRRVCGSEDPNGDYRPEYDACVAFFHTRFVPSVRYARVREESHYQELASLLSSLKESAWGLTKVEIGRIVYLAIPPQFFAQSCELVHRYLRPSATSLGASSRPYLRVIIEKPFGTDFDSALALKAQLSTILKEDEVYLTDHYAGKAAVHAFRDYLERNHQRLSPKWDANHIESMEVRMTETESCEGRIRYFHSTGIIRDIMANHLQLLLGFTAAPSFQESTMLQSEQTEKGSDSQAASFDTRHRLEFIQSLQQEPSSTLRLGQYDTYATHYRQEMGNEMLSEAQDGVNSKLGGDVFAPTAARVELQSTLRNWQSTKFVLSAAKATHERRLNIRIVFHASQPNEENSSELLEPNDPATLCELLVTIQTHKNDDHRKSQRIEWTCDFLDDLEPPTGWEYAADDPLQRSMMPKRLSSSQTQVWNLGDEITAYDTLLHQAALENQRHFASMDEALASWTIWTPIVQQAEAVNLRKAEPLPYLSASVAIYRVGSASWDTSAQENPNDATAPSPALSSKTFNDEL